MPADLHSLAYASRNVMTGGREVLDAGIAAILGTARRTNAPLGVTGALLYSDGCFAQVLEGPMAAVELLFERIQCDPRHCDVSILNFEPVATRSFAAWSMAFASADAARPGLPVLPSLPAGPDAIAAAPAGRDLVVILRDLIGRQDAARLAGH